MVEAGVVGAVIAGGGATNVFGNVYSNSVSGDFATISGGANHRIQKFSGSSTISGGFGNTIHSHIHQVTAIHAVLSVPVIAKDFPSVATARNGW